MCGMVRAIEVDNELFEGKLHVWVDGLDSTPPGFGEEVPPPAPRSRVTLQGRFKEPLPFASLLTGQVSCRSRPNNGHRSQGLGLPALPVQGRFKGPLPLTSLGGPYKDMFRTRTRFEYTIRPS